MKGLAKQNKQRILSSLFTALQFQCRANSLSWNYYEQSAQASRWSAHCTRGPPIGQRKIKVYRIFPKTQRRSVAALGVESVTIRTLYATDTTTTWCI